MEDNIKDFLKFTLDMYNTVTDLSLRLKEITISFLSNDDKYIRTMIQTQYKGRRYYLETWGLEMTKNEEEQWNKLIKNFNE